MKKLFAQEFYNFKKSKKRELAGFALHNHPSSQIDGVFSKWQASETASIESNKVRSPNVQVQEKLRKLQYSINGSSQGISHRDLTKYAIGDANTRGRTQNLIEKSAYNSNQIKAG